jgi:hypothetical protein
VLLEQGFGDGPIHYRRWLSLVEEAGYEVAGRRADAVFLNQVTRSPVVKATTSAGFYEIDFGAPARLSEEIRRLRSSLTAAEAEDFDDRREPGGRSTKTHEVLLAVGRAQRALDEAQQALAAARRREATTPPALSVLAAAAGQN